MKLTNLFVDRLAGRPRIAITGCGGKTSLMIALAQAYSQRGRSVLITTTTKVRNPYELDYGCNTVLLDTYEHVPRKGERVFFAATYDSRKVCAPDLFLLAQISDTYDVVLMEADGSRGLPLKYHNPWDPVVPDFTTDVIALAGISALGKSLDDDTMFNFPSYTAATLDAGRTVTERTLLTLLELDEGIRKGFDGRHGIVLFNQCDILAPGRLAQVMDVVGQKHLYGSVEKNAVYGGKAWIS